MSKVLVGMSGGIDSTVAAYILKEEGHEAEGVTMKIWKDNVLKESGSAIQTQESQSHGKKRRSGACFSPDEEKDIALIEQLCDKIGIKHRVLDLSERYEKEVLGYFRSEYLSGRTPNPCVWCNQKIKFGAMVDEAQRAGLDFDYFATGHYARIFRSSGGRFAVQRALDPAKDQSYFLYRLLQNQLSRVMFPLGGLLKTEVRKIDVSLGFHAPDQSESQDFYSGSYSDLLGVSPESGEITDSSGKVLGRHDGFWNFTVGQRKGIGIAAPEPLYVISIDPDRNRVVVGPKAETESRSVVADNVLWSGAEGEHELFGRTLYAKIRSVGRPSECVLGLISFQPDTGSFFRTCIFRHAGTEPCGLRRGRCGALWRDNFSG